MRLHGQNAAEEQQTPMQQTLQLLLGAKPMKQWLTMQKQGAMTYLELSAAKLLCLVPAHCQLFGPGCGSSLPLLHPL